MTSNFEVHRNVFLLQITKQCERTVTITHSKLSVETKHFTFF